MNFLFEGRVDDFKSKFGQKFGKETDRIISMVQPKYLAWFGRTMSTINFEENFRKVTTALKEFEKLSQNLPLTDINSYKSPESLINELEKYKNRPRRQVKKVQGGNLVYEDNKYYVVNPLTHDSSCYYGKGTKWCTAASTDDHFKRYNDDGKLFYILDKTKDTSDPYYKVAVLLKFDGEVGYWDAQDNNFKSGWILGTPEMEKITSQMNSYLNTEFAEQVKIFSDKEAARKERERIQRLRIEQEEQRKIREADSRRLDGDWELGPGCPDEGLKAHALLSWLEDTSDIDILTAEDRERITEIENEIEELNRQYNEGEEADTDLLDEIEELEEELSDLKEKKDVYYIVPTGRHYFMTSFEVIGLRDREYAVGTEDEVQRSCERYVEDLIDDIGYEGFSKSFVSDYIDDDQVEDYARNFYDDDVRDNPESYFDDSDRQLSDEQEEQKRINDSRIVQYRLEIQKLESISDEEDVDDKIDELTELIEELESENEDIDSSPEGDFPEDIIEEKVDELAKDAAYDSMSFLNEWGLNYTEFIDKDKFIEGVIEADGFGHTLNSYDGNADDVVIDGELYYVMRLN